MPIVQPFHQRAARMQRHSQIDVLLEQIQKREITILIRLLEDPLEVSDWLMIVKNKAESKPRRCHTHKSGFKGVSSFNGARFACSHV
jgi:hypothetical protein